MLLLLLGCAILGPISGGSKPGEFYVTVYHYPIPQGYVLRCEQGREGRTTCERVLNFSDAGALGPFGDIGDAPLQTMSRNDVPAPVNSPAVANKPDDPPGPRDNLGSMTCADVQGLFAAHLTESQLLQAVQGQTIAATELECIQNARLPASVVEELSAHVVGQ